MPMYPSCPRCESSRVRPVLAIEPSTLRAYPGTVRLRCRACDHRWDSTAQQEVGSAAADIAPLRMVGVKPSGEVAAVSYSRPDWDSSMSSR
jgi:hypothetical protein